MGWDRLFCCDHHGGELVPRESNMGLLGNPSPSWRYPIDSLGYFDEEQLSR